MISTAVDSMFQRMHHEDNKERSVASELLRFETEQNAKNNACLRCSKAVFFAVSAPKQTVPKDPSAQVHEFNWRLTQGVCGAFMPIADWVDKGLDKPFQCSGETAEASGGSSATDWPDHLARTGATSSEQPTQPRSRGERQ